MKGNVMGWVRRAAAVAGLSLMALTARAEFVECETPFNKGIPLQSLSRATEGLPNVMNFVLGSSLDATSFAVGSAGQLTVTLTDLVFPRPLQELSVLVTDLHNVWRSDDVAGAAASLLIDIAGPTQLFAAVFARSEARSMPGLYSLNATFAPVPLPAAAWLLLSGIAGLGITVRRRRSRVAS